MLDALTRAVVPPKPALWRRWTALPVFSYYNRLVALVLLVNAVFVLLAVDFAAITVERLSDMVLINLSLAILIRQHYLINALFWLATRVPVTWPLRVRRSVAKVYHFGGLHSGAALAATAWFIAMVGVQVARYLRQPDSVSSAWLWLTGVLLGLLLLMVSMAQPWIRSRFHNGFERVHRFAGWSALLLFWALTLLASSETSTSLLHSGSFWMLVLLTLSIALPWLRLRKVAVEHTRPSGHAVITRFKHTTPFAGSSTAISRNPLLEWHSFANIPAPEAAGFRLIISRAGDWTGRFIEDLPSHVWVKGITTAGVANVETLFKSVVYIATGSGIGPVMPHLLAAQVPIQLIWSTRSPRKTYGDELVDEILRAQPGALIWDTDERGKPDLVQLAYGAVQTFGAEAVICIANQALTERVVHEMEARGIPAYGAIWDS
ncbi:MULTISPECIES: hypothetical protein [Pseudomonas]|uniref:Ferredoxin reductase family protein n=1 Tax=Pseudomonas edaphica TaxID=2006980 RepID=A0A7Y8JLH1_9PSED|nr:MULTISPECIES: hypothetical protein [Pseudomonas]MCF5230160.1 hypothetical protein [Pseudomonas sp. PA-5-4H]MCF5234790.1 hypothetical protein [Pseudomonas sp. PA-5-4G]MCF5249803.1 hypothetical protein [Pseudomonas sp. PA-5-4B]MCF5253478.1 hypothetical protein [Pseudomonas sp. PA-5-4B]MCF5262248.1 hypothetical protein [Pseudomonas sp. PA-5-4A]